MIVYIRAGVPITVEGGRRLDAGAGGGRCSSGKVGVEGVAAPAAAVEGGDG